MMKLNETPVRTSKNFKINNITLEDFELPEKIELFENVSIEKSESEILDICSKANLTYGVSNELEEYVNNNSNSNMRLEAKGEDNIKINYTFDEDNLNLVNQIEIEAEGTSNIYITYNADTDKKCLHNGIIRLTAKENSNVNVTIVNLLNSSSLNFEAIENTIYENANVNYCIVDFGANYSISNYYSNIIGANATNDLKTIYIGTDNQVKDINYIAHLKGEKSNVDIDVQGALKDTAKKNFKGTIDFKRGCKKAVGNENEYCVLLSDKAKSIALPMLLCTEEDVVGNHSTASGKVDKQSLFYIMSRGLSYKEAVKLIVRANFNKIIDRIEDEELKNIVIEEIDNRLN